MAPIPNPVNSSGRRNICCPHYSRCLDQAASQFWDSWDCSYCVYKTEKESIGDMQFIVEGEIPYYPLPTEISKLIL